MHTGENPGVLPNLWDTHSPSAHAFVFTKPSSSQYNLNQHFIRYGTYRALEHIFHYRF